jgi:pimeloyl-ACP methyl ester carboxylesterase
MKMSNGNGLKLPKADLCPAIASCPARRLEKIGEPLSAGLDAQDGIAVASGVVRTSFERKLLWALLISVAIAAALPLSGMLYESVADHRTLEEYPAPGRLIDVGTAVIHVYCTGIADAAPAVVLEAGGGDISLVWGDAQRALSQRHRVCSYDRAGQGWSSPSRKPRNAEQIAEELHRALVTAHEAGRYVIVGHSRGGIYARTFAQLFPGEVAALVLVDSSVDTRAYALGTLQIEERQFRLLELGARLARFGVPRLQYEFGAIGKHTGPLGVEEALRLRAPNIEANYEEMAAVRAGDYGPQIKDGALRCTPLVVLTSTGPLKGIDAISPAERTLVDAYRAKYQKAQTDFLRLSCNHRQIFASHAGHYIYKDDPALFAAAVEGAYSGNLADIPGTL